MITKAWIKSAAQRMGFDLCGIAPAAVPELDKDQYLWWIEQGFHGEMSYMERQQRQDIRLLFPEVRSVICAGMVYNSPFPKSTECPDPHRGWISRYGWGDDYHDVLRDRLEQLLSELRAAVGRPFEARVYVDTGPLLERTIARAAGVGWIAKNTCLNKQTSGSWFMVGEILTSLEIEPDEAPTDRCGTCTRCIDACPTAAIVEPGILDATRCIAYFTIEARGAVPEEFRPAVGRHVFGCDICQDVCPWNHKAPVTLLPQFQPRKLEPKFGNRESGIGNRVERSPEGERAGADSSSDGDGAAAVSDSSSSLVTCHSSLVTALTSFNPPLDWLASLSEEEFKTSFRNSPVKRAKYRGMLRNVATAMGNSGDRRYRPILQELTEFPDAVVQKHARWAMERLEEAQSANRQTE